MNVRHCLKRHKQASKQTNKNMNKANKNSNKQKENKGKRKKREKKKPESNIICPLSSQTLINWAWWYRTIYVMLAF